MSGAVPPRPTPQSVLDAFSMQEADVDALTRGIYDARVQGYVAAYHHNIASAGGRLPAGWAPPDSVLEDLAVQSREQAAAVAATYDRDLARYVSAHAAAWSSDSEAAAFVQGWATDRARWKAPQVATTETGYGVHRGGRDALAAVAEDPEGFGLPADAEVEVAVVPEGGCPLCEEWAGNVYGPEDAADLPDFPLHPGCDHQILVTVNGEEAGQGEDADSALADLSDLATAEEGEGDGSAGAGGDATDAPGDDTADDGSAAEPQPEPSPEPAGDEPPPWDWERRPFDPATSPAFQGLLQDPNRGAVPIGRHPWHDTWQEDFARELGYADAPPQGTKAQLDALIQQGGEELLRGVRDPQFIEQFRTGDIYYGIGNFGAVIYTAYGDVAQGVADAYSAGNAEGVLRMALRPEARVVTWADARERYTADLLAHMESALADPTLSAAERQAQMGAWGKMMTTPVRWALTQGYDAIRVEDEGYMLLLNRQAVLLQAAAR